jgi:hypothetical protein
MVAVSARTTNMPGVEYITLTIVSLPTGRLMPASTSFATSPETSARSTSPASSRRTFSPLPLLGRPRISRTASTARSMSSRACA